MTQEQAERIAFQWHYDGEYSFYNMETDSEELAEFLNPEERGDSIFAVTKGNKLAAFLSLNKVDANTMDIGLGMRPDLTGKGNGPAFLEACISFIRDEKNHLVRRNI